MEGPAGARVSNCTPLRSGCGFASASAPRRAVRHARPRRDPCGEVVEGGPTELLKTGRRVSIRAAAELGLLWLALRVQSWWRGRCVRRRVALWADAINRARVAGAEDPRDVERAVVTGDVHPGDFRNYLVDLGLPEEVVRPRVTNVFTLVAAKRRAEAHVAGSRARFAPWLLPKHRRTWRSASSPPELQGEVQGERLEASPDAAVGECDVDGAQPLTLAGWLDAVGLAEWHAALRAEGFRELHEFSMLSPADVASLCDKYGAPAKLAVELGFFASVADFAIAGLHLTRDGFAARRAAYVPP